MKRTKMIFRGVEMVQKCEVACDRLRSQGIDFRVMARGAWGWECGWEFSLSTPHEARLVGGRVQVQDIYTIVEWNWAHPVADPTPGFPEARLVLVTA